MRCRRRARICPMRRSGSSEAAPRALPQDFAVALTSTVIDGGVVVKAAAGRRAVAGRVGRGAADRPSVLPDAAVAGQFVAATLAIWNPVCRRTPAAGALEPARRLRLPAVGGGGDAAAARTRTAMGRCVAAGVLDRAGRADADGADARRDCRDDVRSGAGCGQATMGCAAVSLGAAVLAALPWLVAAMVAESLSSSQAEGVGAFAARAEPGLGTLFSLARLGGIWNGEAVPDSRTTLFAFVAAVVLLAVVAVGAADRSAPAGARCRCCAGGRRRRRARADGDRPRVWRPSRRRCGRCPDLGCCATRRSGSRSRCLVTPSQAPPRSSRCGTGCRPWPPRRLLPALFAVLPDLALGVGGKVTSVRVPAGLGGGRGADQRTTRARSRCCRRTACGASPGPATRRCSTRSRAGCRPTCWPRVTC